MTDVFREVGGNEDLVPPAARTGRKEAWLGFFVLVGGLAIVVALLAFTGTSAFHGRYTISTIVPDAAGIRQGDQVQFRGVSIGRIRGFDMSPAGVVVRLEIEKRYRVPRDAHVALSPSALFGGAVAQIVGGESPEAAVPGAVLPGASAPPLQEKVIEAAGESQKALERVQDLLSDRTVEGVQGSVEQLQALLAELSQTVAAERSDIDRIVHNLNGAAHDAQKIASSPALKRSVERLDTITANLDAAAASIDRASRSMEVVTGRIERGEGTLGRLAKDDTLYRNANDAVANLNRTTTEVRALAMDLRLNPSRYVHLSLF